MKANELMIGNWVEVISNDHLKCVQIAEIYKSSILTKESEFESEEVSIDNIEPIPLTPEILEKNNFRKVIWQGRRCTEITTYAIGEGLNLEEYNDGFILVDNCSDLGDYGYESNYICDIKYVHELQHALRLCGIEKNIII